VLEADFHIHTFPLSWGVISPMDTVVEAGRQGLDVIALTPHNHTWVAKLGRWFSEWTGGPMVLVGEELHSIGFHVLAVGITETISWRQLATPMLDDIHRQGGVAIAAHPIARYSRGYDTHAMQKLDGAEVVHPLTLLSETSASQLREFFGRTRLTAVGDSDYHLGPMAPNVGAMGLCRTYVFVRSRSEKDVLDALRQGHTLVYDRGRIYGDPDIMKLAAEDGRLPNIVPAARLSVVDLLIRLAGLFGLVALILNNVARTDHENSDQNQSDPAKLRR
jgi:hypothetical protein